MPTSIPAPSAEQIAHALGGAQKSGEGWKARCPAHDDAKPSLSIRDTRGHLVLKCFAGCPSAKVRDALRSRGLLPTKSGGSSLARINGTRVDLNADAAKQSARAIWDEAKPVKRHPYLERKHVKAHGIRVARDGRLVVPAYDIDGNLAAVQLIDIDGEKRTATGCSTRGAFFLIEPRIRLRTAPLLIAEGYATAATLHEETGHAAAVAFGAGNLRPVAEALRSKHPDRTIVICADNDHHKLNGANPGIAKAREAAQAVGALLFVPKFKEGDPGTDWNDFANRRTRLRLKSNSIKALLDVLLRDGATASETAGYDLGEASSDATAIDCSPGNRASVVDRCMAVIAAHPVVYQRAGTLVRVVRADKLDRDERLRTDAERLLIGPCPAEWLATELARRVMFQRKSGMTMRVCDPPGWLAQALLADGVFEGVRPLRGITSSPVLRPDGSVWASAGYDTQTGMLLAVRGELPMVPDSPTKGDARRALERLRRLFSKYAFADEFGESVALALVLTKVARHLMPTAPFFLFTSPTAGSGKTQIVQAASIIADGVSASLCSWPGEDEEMRKATTSALLAGETFVVFDNVANGKVLRSATLDKTLTAPVIQDRLLGRTQTVTLPNNAVWAATGNNVTPSADMVRRTVVARIDPGVERPWSREFPWTPSEYARKRRAKLLAAALTILSAHLRITDRAALSAPMQSFEDWSRIVRDALIWLDMPDPVRSQELLADEDPDAEQRAELLNALQGQFGAETFTADDVAKACRQANSTIASEEERVLLHAVQGRLGHKPITPQAAGYLLRAIKGQVTGRFVLRSSGLKYAGAKRWHIVRRHER